jgi:hypothetical protein
MYIVKTSYITVKIKGTRLNIGAENILKSLSAIDSM